VSETPLDIPRPAQETVLKSVKRLHTSYSMLSQDILLHPVSALVTSHLVKGRAAVEVIDELEQLFRDSYSDWLQSRQ